MKNRMQAIFGFSLVAVLIAAAVCLFAVTRGSNQATLASLIPQRFEGEYSRDGQTWMPLTPQSDLSADKGELYLRGRFQKPILEGHLLCHYSNHIGMEIRSNGERIMMNFPMEMHRLGIKMTRSGCGRLWESILMPEIKTDDLIEIRLYNPHRYGNRNAYREFLGTLCITGTNTEILQKKLEIYGKSYRMIGSVLMVAALMILGASAFAIIMRLKKGVLWLICGLMTLFAGASIFFDTIDICFWNDLVVFNTYVWQMSVMLTVLCAGYCVYGKLTDRAKKAAGYALLISTAIDAALIILSCLGDRRIFDMLPVWAASQAVFCPVMMVCCVWQTAHDRDEKSLLPVSGLLFFAAVIADLLGIGGSIFSCGVCAKAVFIVLFIVHILLAGRNVAKYYMASMRVDRMERELEDSRVAIMLSQIQPHFLYNSLSVIQELCHSDPPEAERAIGRFAEFLRGNMTALTSEKVIPFADELHHIKSYLEIEKLRFGDQLSVRYEIEEEGFSLPTLTLQPLVENAVRHGVRKNENGGTVTISVREHADCHEIVIADDGPGFSPEGVKGGDGVHVGIENVKKRLERMCGGSLQIHSAPGMGTRVTVCIPKEEKVC